MPSISGPRSRLPSSSTVTPLVGGTARISLTAPRVRPIVPAAACHARDRRALSSARDDDAATRRPLQSPQTKTAPRRVTAARVLGGTGMSILHRRLLRLWAAIAAPAAIAPLVAAGNVGGGGLVGPTWQVTAATTTVPAWQGVVPVADQQRYTISFANDGTAAIKADCNQVTATYTTTPGGTIKIVPGPSTMAMCPEDSMGQPF